MQTHELEPEHDAAKIAALNDLFRTSLEGGRVMLTRGIACQPDHVQARILEAVTRYDFDTDAARANDPHGEHDFGVIEDADAGRVLFKIDYYDAALEHGSEDPTDPAQTTRVLTIMLAGEY